MKIISPADEPLAEMNGEKRLWMKAEDMTLDIYKNHLRQTIFNTDLAVLTTQDYVPEYLRGIVAKKLGTLLHIYNLKCENYY